MLSSSDRFSVELERFVLTEQAPRVEEDAIELIKNLRILRIWGRDPQLSPVIQRLVEGLADWSDTQLGAGSVVERSTLPGRRTEARREVPQARTGRNGPGWIRDILASKPRIPVPVEQLVEVLEEQGWTSTAAKRTNTVANMAGRAVDQYADVRRIARGLYVYDPPEVAQDPPGVTGDGAAPIPEDASIDSPASEPEEPIPPLGVDDAPRGP